jgi:uncharacterized protein DUF4386
MKMARDSVRRYAVVGGLLLLISLVAGSVGEVNVPTKLIVSSDAAATARNIGASGLLFRLGFAGYLVEGLSDVALTLIFYVLLRPVDKPLALCGAFFGLLATAVFAVAELFYFAPSLILEDAVYLKTFSPDQLNTIALLSLKIYGQAAGILMAFGGVGAVINGYLIFQSGYLPRLLGVILALGGIGFVARNFALVLFPTYASDLLLIPMPLAMLLLALWLLSRGVNVSKWEERVAPELQLSARHP